MSPRPASARSHAERVPAAMADEPADAALLNKYDDLARVAER